MGLPNYIVNLDELADEIISSLEDTTITKIAHMYKKAISKKDWTFRTNKKVLLYGLDFKVNNLHREVEQVKNISVFINKKLVGVYEISDYYSKERVLELGQGFLLAPDDTLSISGDTEVLKSANIIYSNIDYDKGAVVSFVYTLYGEVVKKSNVFIYTPALLEVPEVNISGLENEEKEEKIEVEKGITSLVKEVPVVETKVKIFITCLDENERLIYRDMIATERNKIITITAPFVEGYEVISEDEKEIDPKEDRAVTFIYEEKEEGYNELT